MGTIADEMNKAELDRFLRKHGDRTLWRYMSFIKLMDLVDSRLLRFSNLTSFDDRYEGELSDEEKSMLREMWKDALKDKPHSERDEEIAAYLSCKAEREKHCILCFCESDRESSVMWNAYAPHYGVVIKTNVRSVLSQIRDNPKNEYFFKSENGIELSYNSVVYDTPNSKCKHYFRKRSCYSGEQEFRVVLSRSAGFLNPEDHAYVYPRWIKTAVVPSKLIHEIYLSPSLAEWEIHTIRRFLKRRLKNTPVHESVLSGSPEYLSPPSANEVKDFLERMSS